MGKRIPKFKSLEEERKFWDTHPIDEYLDDLKPAKVQFTKPRKRLISLRLDTDQVESLKKLADRQGLGYLTLIRLWINQHLLKQH